jgi:maltoporin
LQKFRLGNEGDNYLEFGIGKKFDLGNGLKLGVHYMPKVYNGTPGTAQGYVDISGLDALPGATLWAGQRYHRLEDIHILDRWVMEDGDNFGVGVDNVKLGPGKLNLGVYAAGTFDDHGANTNNARRVSFQWHGLSSNPGGKLTLTGSLISGDFAAASAGSAWGVRHNQVLAKGLNNTLFVQTANGHADINGKFYGLGNVAAAAAAKAAPGARQFLFADALTWQAGRFGGQAVLGYATSQPDDGNEIADYSFGGRLSYSLAAHAKVLAEAGSTRRTGAGAEQTLDKMTLALALSPNPDFWSRPEVRLYMTYISWNEAAAASNASTFGVDGRSSDTIGGIQVEAWW